MQKNRKLIASKLSCNLYEQVYPSDTLGIEDDRLEVPKKKEHSDLLWLLHTWLTIKRIYTEEKFMSTLALLAMSGFLFFIFFYWLIH